MRVAGHAASFPSMCIAKGGGSCAYTYIFRACSYGQKLSRLPRKHFDKFTSDIVAC